MEITDKCSLQCLHCSSNSSPAAKQELKLEEIRRIIDDFKDLGGKVLEISGGEPLLHKDVCKVIGYGKAKGLQTRLYTNGIYLNDAFKEFVRIGLDRVLLGLYGASPAVHDSITGQKGSFSKTIKAIENLRQKGIYVGIHFVPTKINYCEIESLAKMAERINVDELAILRFVPQGRGAENEGQLLLDDKEESQLLKSLKYLRKRYGFLRLGCPMDQSLDCKAGESILTIKPDGFVSLCPAFKNDKIVGNARKQGLKQIWEKSSVLAEVRQTREGKKACLARSFYNS